MLVGKVQNLSKQIIVPSVRLFSSSSTQPDTGYASASVDYKTASPFNKIPAEPFRNLIVRYLKDKNYLQKGHLLFRELHEKHGPIFKVSIPFQQAIILVEDPEDVKHLLNNDGKNPIEPGFKFFVEYRQNLRKDLFPETAGLGGSQGEKWYEVRSKVQQDMLRPKSALFYIDEITGVSDDLLDLMVGGGTGDKKIVPDVSPFLYRWSLEAVCAIFLDTRIGCLDVNPSHDAKEMIRCSMISLGPVVLKLMFGLPLWKLYRTKNLDDFDMASERMHIISSRYISDAKKKFKTNNITDPDKMSVLQKLIHKCGPDSKIPEVMAIDALGAGIDTTGNTAAFLLYHLASNPVQQEILYKEIKDKLGDEKLTPAILNQMKYLKAVQHESQRLMPAVGFFSRITQKEMVLSGYQIPTGTHVSFMSMGPMLSEKHFTNADAFVPERWLRDCPQKHNAHPFAFIPFSHGARMCIGRRFAELEIQILAIQTLRKYQLVYKGESPVEMLTEFLNKPDKAIPIRFIPR